jgi:hypothetical protein
MNPSSTRRFRSRLTRLALAAGCALLAPGMDVSLAETGHAANAPGYPADFADAQWQAAYAKNGIAVSRADIPGSPIVAFQAETVLDAPIETVVGVIQDNPRRPEWTPSLAEARVLERFSETEWIEYWHLDTPIVISDREAVVRIRTEFDSFEKDYPYDLLAGLRKQLARKDREFTPHPTIRKAFEEAAANAKPAVAN